MSHLQPKAGGAVDSPSKEKIQIHDIESPTFLVDQEAFNDLDENHQQQETKGLCTQPVETVDSLTPTNDDDGIESMTSDYIDGSRIINFDEKNRQHDSGGLHNLPNEPFHPLSPIDNTNDVESVTSSLMNEAIDDLAAAVGVPNTNSATTESPTSPKSFQNIIIIIFVLSG